MSKIGEGISQNPQNINLSAIIEANEKIKLIQSQSKKVPVAGVAPADASGSEISKLVSTWITLQNAVNCYMDSSKDPNPLSKGGPQGIRQLLERKEGLFRQHMMGKRVNFCCRSVISPDPYIGTNEIGIPVAFAKVLTFPTPVNDWNFKYLRGLVEKGSHEYPGNYLASQHYQH